MSNNIHIVMMRHSYDDDTYIDGKNDTDLTSEGIQIAKNAAMNLSAKLGDLNAKVGLRSGPKKRSVQTLEILAEQLYADGIPYSITRDNKLTELFQGKMELDGLTHYEKVAGLHYAWIAFNQERTKGNFNYRFGHPHPEMRSDFIVPPYGETQNEFLLRMADALMSVIEDNAKEHNIPVVIAHRGGIREFMNMSNALNNNIDFSQSQICDISQLQFCDVREIDITDTNIAMTRLQEYANHLRNRMQQR